MSTALVTIVVPAFDEARRIGRTLHALRDWEAQTGRELELLVVDDGSTDGTAAVVEALDLGVRVLRTPTNRGKGHAVRVGMLAASGGIRVLFDADGATAPDQLPRVLQPIEAGDAEVAIGSRYVEGARVATPQPWHRRVWSRLANRVVQWLLLPGIADTHCGCKAFRGDVAEAVFGACTIDGWSFDLEALALARQLGARVVEVGVTWADDADSRGRITDVPRMVAEVLRIRRALTSSPEPGPGAGAP